MDFIVFSHLRWNFVFQRPQHLMSRCARGHRVFFWEEPVLSQSGAASLTVTRTENSLTVVVPQLPSGLTEQESWKAQSELLHRLLREQAIDDFAAWYYTPMAMNFARDLQPRITVYDCMDELSAFRGAPPGLTSAEAELFGAADLIFTGGQSLYEAKRSHHPSVHCFPSSIDFSHFAQAREFDDDPPDQLGIPRPRFGYCGVIDERMDLDLLAIMSEMRPGWQFVMVGPVVKISEADLPHRPNIHFLGAKGYKELPAYLAGWDAAMLPFALNESTRFISPTKTPEYLAAGRQVVSTPITDVIRPYGNLGLVRIAATPSEFVSALEQAIANGEPNAETERLHRVDAFLAKNSWDITWKRMLNLIVNETSQHEASDAAVATTSNDISAD